MILLEFFKVVREVLIWLVSIKLFNNNKCFVLLMEEGNKTLQFSSQISAILHLVFVVMLSFIFAFYNLLNLFIFSSIPPNSFPLTC